MNSDTEGNDDLSHLSNRDLLMHLTQSLSLLAKKEIELAKTELRSEIRSGIVMAGSFGVALAAGYAAVILLLVTCIFAFATFLPGWASGLIVSGFALLVSLLALLVGWRSRVKAVLPHTKETLKEDAQWTKDLTK